MTIPSALKEKLLRDKRVIEEINRHLWCESEKVGRDIGFQKAQEDWLARFSRSWMEYNMPQELARINKSPESNSSNSKISPTRRRAKSYFK